MVLNYCQLWFDRGSHLVSIIFHLRGYCPNTRNLGKLDPTSRLETRRMMVTRYAFKIPYPFQQSAYG